ncbi:hypothetical protein EMMF5_006314 [Cystobasidiomycetes sp. EMM_F5]
MQRSSESVDSTDTASLSGSTVVEKTWTNEEEQYARALREEDDVTVGCFGRAKNSFSTSDRNGRPRRTDTHIYGPLSSSWGSTYPKRQATESNCIIA